MGFTNAELWKIYHGRDKALRFNDTTQEMHEEFKRVFGDKWADKVYRKYADKLNYRTEQETEKIKNKLK